MSHTDTYLHQMQTYARQIVVGAKAADQRTGQWMFNKLPNEIARVVSGTSFDPFHYDMTEYEIFAWIDRHLIFDGYHIVGVFHNDRLLWEGQGPNYAADHIRADSPPTTPLIGEA